MQHNLRQYLRAARSYRGTSNKAVQGITGECKMCQESGVKMRIKKIGVRRDEGYKPVMLSPYGWPEGISDGLSIRCKFCGRLPYIDYHIKDEVWKKVISKEYRTGVVCLDCFIDMALRIGVDISNALEELQIVTRQGQTICAYPSVVFHYEENNRFSENE